MVVDERVRARSPLLSAVAVDNSLPISPVAVDLWLRDIENPLRWIIRPVLQLVFAALLHVTWALKRLPLPQFRAHRLLQWTICAFCRNFVKCGVAADLDTCSNINFGELFISASDLAAVDIGRAKFNGGKARSCRRISNTRPLKSIRSASTKRRPS